MRFFVAIFVIGMGIFGGFSFVDMKKAQTALSAKESELAETTRDLLDARGHNRTAESKANQANAKIVELENTIKNTAEMQKAETGNKEKLDQATAELAKNAQALESAKMQGTELEETKKKLTELTETARVDHEALLAAQSQLTASKAEVTRLQALLAKPPIGGVPRR
jgi:chromosome segregation ATPase